MAELTVPVATPIPEQKLRELSKNLSQVLPAFAESDPDIGVKNLHEAIVPLLDTADSPDLPSTHRAAVSNALCAIVEKCQAVNVQYAQDALLDDCIWLRLFRIYLERSDSAKGKSVRQVLLVLTSTLLRSANPRALELRLQASSAFLDIICLRSDRLKVKPALQGLAHFLQKDVVTIPQLIVLHSDLLKRKASANVVESSPQVLLSTFIAWIVHHDTSLSAGHLIRSFLARLRQSPMNYIEGLGSSSPLWMHPVVEQLSQWPEEIQEFKNHVFPHCFLPNIDEYLSFLAYLRFAYHTGWNGLLPETMQTSEPCNKILNSLDEFKVLLAAIQTGKELGIVKDADYRTQKKIEADDNTIYLPDNMFHIWLSHPAPEIRLAGLFLSIHSTAITRPVTGGILRSLKCNLVHLHTDTDAGSRKEMLGYLQKLFDRLRGSTSALVKMKAGSRVDHNRLPFPAASFMWSRESTTNSSQDLLLEALQFVAWYLSFLQSDLCPTASYQRRITSLKALIIVLKSGLDSRVPHQHLSKSAQGQLHWFHDFPIVDGSLIRILLDLVFDPFDDIRDTVILTLRICFDALQPIEMVSITSALSNFIDRAERMMLRTGRADQADGVARAYSLLFATSRKTKEKTLGDSYNATTPIGIFQRLVKQLQDTLQFAQESLSESVNGRPVHGIYASIRYIIDCENFYSFAKELSSSAFLHWRDMHNSVCDTFEVLWTCIKHVLCADAPEGHVPEEIEDEDTLDTKEILSYSWRGLKEASVLLRVIITKAPIGEDDRCFMTPQRFEELGRLCFTQLLDIRHRGAFSTVAQTFAAFCRRCFLEVNTLLHALPFRWYEATLLSIQDKAASITRRSAGIPALLSSILAAEPQTQSELFSRAMSDLVFEASRDAESLNIKESRLPQVHALNCIKEIFTTSKLSVASESRIGEGLELAASILNSKIWPIRNSGLMLFKALIERLLGSDESQDWKDRQRARTSRFSYHNYPTLVSILTNLLRPDFQASTSKAALLDSGSPLDLHGTEGVFPALQILRQAAPPMDHREKIRLLIQNLYQKPHWHLREMAARTVVSLIPARDLVHFVVSTPLNEGNNRPNNNRHGILLAVKHAMKRMMQHTSILDDQTLSTLLHQFSMWSKDWFTNCRCGYVKASFLDITYLLGLSITKRKRKLGLIQDWNALVASLQTGGNGSLPDATGNALLDRGLIQMCMMDWAIDREVNASDKHGFQKSPIIGDTFLLLANRDADACLIALDALDEIVLLAPKDSPTAQKALILVQIYRLRSHTQDAEVISKAHTLLADALDLKVLTQDFFDLLSSEQIVDALGSLERQCLYGSPSSVQGTLRLLGHFLDIAYKKCDIRRRVVFQVLAKYIRLLRVTIVDTNPFDIRFAAAQSIVALECIWTAPKFSKKTAPLMLGLTLVLYDLLNDDDDEIRDVAASAAAKLLRTRKATDLSDAVPIITSHRIATFLSDTYTDSRYLTKEALCRLTESPSRSQLFSLSSSELFQRAQMEDNALFAIEKQNLYKDDVLDAVFWKRILCTQSYSAISTTDKDAFTRWVLEGLDILINTAKSDQDTALGWTSKIEVFTFGMRIFCASEVLLAWRVIEASKVRTALREFADVGAESKIHGTWLKKVERVLEKDVLAMLGSVKESLLRIKAR